MPFFTPWYQLHSAVKINVKASVCLWLSKTPFFCLLSVESKERLGIKIEKLQRNWIEMLRLEQSQHSLKLWILKENHIYAIKSQKSLKLILIVSFQRPSYFHALLLPDSLTRSISHFIILTDIKPQRQHNKFQEFIAFKKDEKEKRKLSLNIDKIFGFVSQRES